MDLVKGALGSIIAVIICWLYSKYLKSFVAAFAWRGTKIDGDWEFYDARPGPGVVAVGSVKIAQHGTKITAVSKRVRSRDGESTSRVYENSGRFCAQELVLVYHAIDRPDIRLGSIVLHLDQQAHIFSGKTMTYDEPTQQIIVHPIWFRSTLAEKGADY